MAQASGLTLLKNEERNPLHTSTYGTGEMILDAISKGCRRFVIGLGGSATNDAGIGMLEALGVTFRDENGKPITGCCGSTLSRIQEIDDSFICPEIRESEFIVACDVNTPFCGKNGATYTFARQKGANDAEMNILEEGMQRLSEIILKKYRINLSETPGTGAAGGVGGAFKAILGAELKSGSDMILDTIGFNRIAADADLVITGEGRIDFQTSKGKLIDGIIRRCSKLGVPALAIAGIIDSTDLPIRVEAIGPRPENESDLENAMRPEVAYRNISDTVAKVLKELSPSLCHEIL